jgi:hypothetical protein
MPLLFAGGVCCWAVGAGLAGAEEAEELEGAGIAVGVGLVGAGGGVELERLDADAGAGELAGVELAAGVLPAGVSADFLERAFFGVVSAGLSGLSADLLERDFLVVVVEESAAVELSAASADFLDRLFFLGVASASVEAPAASAESALLFFERLFLVPVSVAVPSAVLAEPSSAASAGFLDRLFFVVDLLLSAAVELSLALFFGRLFLVVEESAGAELSALSELFFLDLDLVLLVESAELPVDGDESSALAFFLDFFFVVVELSL